MGGGCRAAHASLHARSLAGACLAIKKASTYRLLWSPAQRGAAAHGARPCAPVRRSQPLSLTALPPLRLLLPGPPAAPQDRGAGSVGEGAVCLWARAACGRRQERAVLGGEAAACGQSAVSLSLAGRPSGLPAGVLLARVAGCRSCRRFPSSATSCRRSPRDTPLSDAACPGVCARRTAVATQAVCLLLHQFDGMKAGYRAARQAANDAAAIGDMSDWDFLFLESNGGWGAAAGGGDGDGGRVDTVRWGWAWVELIRCAVGALGTSRRRRRRRCAAAVAPSAFFPGCCTAVPRSNCTACPAAVPPAGDLYDIIDWQQPDQRPSWVQGQE